MTGIESGGRSWQSVLAHIEADLVSGRLRPGQHLAPERALAAELGVGRSSVREAVRVLEVLGLVRTQTGSGPTSGAIVIASPNQGMSLLMRLQVAATGFPVADIVSTRLLLEASVVAELAAQLGPGGGPEDVDLSDARALLAGMDGPGLTPGEFLALDARFHLALAEASGNQVVAAMMAGLRNSIEGYVLDGATALPDWSETATRLRAEHRGILEAILARDPALASDRVREHITGYYAEGFPDGRAPNLMTLTGKRT